MLLRISSLDVTRFIPWLRWVLSMTVVGMDAKLLRGPGGKDLYYTTNSVTVGGGQSFDAIMQVPAGATPGTRYFLYTTNLNHLSNDTEPFGGMMTEIRVN